MLCRELFFIVGVLMFRISSEKCISRESVTATEGEYFYLKPCLNSEYEFNMTTNMTTIKWYKEDVQLNFSSSSRITFSGYYLEFWPIELDDSGNYEFHTGNHTRRWKVNVARKSVNSCFTKDHISSRTAEVNKSLEIKCEDDYYKKLTNRTLLYKNCEKTENSNNPSHIRKNAEFKDQGYYTCVFVIPHNGKLFNATSTFNITITKANRIINPAFYGPSTERIPVELGKDALLNCSAFVNIENHIYFQKINLPNVYEDQPSSTWDEEGKQLVSKILRIKNVNKRNLEITYYCLLIKRDKLETKTFTLVEKEMKDIPRHIFTTGMITVIFISVAVGSMVILGVIYRVDLVLFYRYLMRRDETLTDGKTYDAFVSYLKEYQSENGEEHTFAVEILPRVLEKHFGYKLCIFERDVVPGRAVVDEIHSLIEKSRRLIIILSKSYMANEVRYELESGLHEALVERKLKIILIKCTSASDFTFLPQSLQLLKSHRILKWKADKSLTYNSRFWKNLLYLMPAKVIKPYRDETEILPVY